MILYPALLPLYKKSLRKRHYHYFKRAFIEEADKLEFWRNVEDKMNIELRFTSSEDYTLGYMDFLDTRITKDAYEGPNIPMTLLVSGNGSFNTPFVINA